MCHLEIPEFLQTARTLWLERLLTCDVPGTTSKRSHISAFLSPRLRTKRGLCLEVAARPRLLSAVPRHLIFCSSRHLKNQTRRLGIPLVLGRQDIPRCLHICSAPFVVASPVAVHVYRSSRIHALEGESGIADYLLWQQGHFSLCNQLFECAYRVYQNWQGESGPLPIEDTSIAKWFRDALGPRGKTNLAAHR